MGHTHAVDVKSVEVTNDIVPLQKTLRSKSSALCKNLRYVLPVIWPSHIWRPISVFKIMTHQMFIKTTCYYNTYSRSIHTIQRPVKGVTRNNQAKKRISNQKNYAIHYRRATIHLPTPTSLSVPRL